VKTSMPVYMVLLALTAGIVHAEEPRAAWLYENRDNHEVVAQYETGVIEGANHIALITQDGNDDEAGAIYLLKTDGTHIEQLARVETVKSPESYSMKISRDSLFIQLHHAHHGVYLSQYQFKKRGGAFVLIGFESQSLTPSYDSLNETDRDNPKYLSMDMWRGSSVNLLTSKTECWLQTFDLAKGENSQEWKQWSEALGKLDRGQGSGTTIRKTFSFSPMPLIAIDKVNMLEPEFPECYFDYKGVVHPPPVRSRY